MLLSDNEILRELKSGNLVINPGDGKPLDPDHVQPASVDLHLSGTLRKLDGLKIPVYGGYWLFPQAFILGDTDEHLKIPPYLAAQFAGKSSLGRIGLQTHCTAGFVDPGFEGTLTVELSNLSDQPVRLYTGMAIGQICLFRLTSPAQRPYGSEGLGSHYQGQSGPTPSHNNDVVI